MENSLLFSSTLTDEASRFYTFVSGEYFDRHSAAQRVAWKLEGTATEYGWPTGYIVGSEQSLIKQFGVSRDTFREAVRIVEYRGSMCMIRGRNGGLGITRPSLSRAAMAFALYLRAIGCTVDQATEATGVLSLWRPGDFESRKEEILRKEEKRYPTAPMRLNSDPLQVLYMVAIGLLTHTLAGDGARLPDAARHLHYSTDRMAVLSPLLKGVFTNRNVRAYSVAVRLIEQAACSGLVAGYRLGSEWDLSCEFNTSQTIIRQTLCMLTDFEMLESRRGRTGGVFIKRPSPAGIVRQLFPFLAVEYQNPYILMDLVWDLNVAHLRLCTAKLAGLPEEKRMSICRSLERRIDQRKEPNRWVGLQKEIGEIADNPIIDTLLRCVVAYQTRRHFPPEFRSHGLGDELLVPEKQIVAALRRGDNINMEYYLRMAQSYVTTHVKKMVQENVMSVRIF